MGKSVLCRRCRLVTANPELAYLVFRFDTDVSDRFAGVVLGDRHFQPAAVCSSRSAAGIPSARSQRSGTKSGQHTKPTSSLPLSDMTTVWSPQPWTIGPKAYLPVIAAPRRYSCVSAPRTLDIPKLYTGRRSLNPDHL